MFAKIVSMWEQALPEMRKNPLASEVPDVPANLKEVLLDYNKVQDFIAKGEQIFPRKKEYDINEFSEGFFHRSVEVGPELALMEFEQYLFDGNYNYNHVMILNKVSPPIEYTFANGVQMVSWESLIRKLMVDPPNLPQLLREFSSQVTCALIHTISNQDKIDDSREVRNRTPFFDPQLTWTKWAISLSTGDMGCPELWSGAIIPRRFWFLAGRECGAFINEPSPMPKQIDLEKLKAANTSIRLINKFDAASIERLHDLLDFFHRSQLLWEPVTKAMPLRICLENIFVNPKEKYQLTKKIGQRGQDLFGESASDRTKIYEILSSAVHSGRLDPDREFSSFFIGELIQKQIMRVLEEGHYRDWPQ